MIPNDPESLLIQTTNRLVWDSVRVRNWILLIALGLGTVSTGCRQSQDSPSQNDSFNSVQETVVTPEPMTMLVIGDQDLGQRIARQWSARRDGILTIVDQSAADFTSGNFEIPAEIDIVVYPPVMMTELVERELVLPMPDDIWNSDQLGKNDMLRHFRLSVVRYSDQPWAVPLGNPNFTMLCNRERFERLNLLPPTTWQELTQTIEKTDAENSGLADSEQVTSRVDMPLAEGWASSMFLARVAPAIRHPRKLSTVFDRSTMKPLIASPPFVDALNQLKAIATKRSVELSPSDVFELAISGESTIAFSWPARAFTDLDSAGASATDKTGSETLWIRSLPGMPQWYDQQTQSWTQREPGEPTQVELIGVSGLIASVAAQCRDDRAAWNLLEWLASKPISSLILAESPTVGPFRASHLGDISRWTGDAISADVSGEFADVVAASHARSLVFMFPQLSGNQRYLAALDEAIREFVSGVGTAEEALENVALEWEAITESLDRQKQILGLRK